MNLFAGRTNCRLGEGMAWLNEPPQWHLDENGLSVTPSPHTDFFRPSDGSPSDNAGLLYAEATGDFTIATHVSAHLVGFGDAGAVMVRAGPTKWAKLCVERSPLGEVSIVTVVTDPWSDDANGELLGGAERYLRLTRKGNVLGMHHSSDGKVWRFVRTCALDLPATVNVGVLAQAPFGEGCRATFRFLDLRPGAVRDFRSGE